MPDLTFSRIVTKRIGIVSLILIELFGYIVVPPQVFAADNSAFCATVTDIPAAECEALMDIYDNTGGTSWTTQAGWGSSTTVCGGAWTGVTCFGGHVFTLDLSGNNLVGNFAFTHGTLGSLNELYIQNNALTGLDLAGVNSSLMGIDMNNNLISTLQNIPGVPYELMLYNFGSNNCLSRGSLDPLIVEWIDMNGEWTQNPLCSGGGDVVPPIIQTLSPADGVNSVELNANLVMTFSEIVSAGTGNITIQKTSDNSIIETIDVTSGQVTGGGTDTITINPSVTLDGSTGYYIQVGSAAIKDAADNPFAGIADSTTWNFTTIDLTPPNIQTLSPADGVNSVELNANLVMTFSESVSVGTGNITLKKISDNSTVESIDITSGQVTGWGTNTITINPSVTLDNSTDYYVQVTAGAFKDAAENPFAGIADSTTWNFTTVDLMPLTIQSLSPSDGAIGVSRTANFLMTFSEVVSVGIGNIIIKKVSDNSVAESIDITSGQVTGGGTNTITINPSITLDGSTDYYIQLDAGAIKYADDNSFAGITDNSTWNFSTVTLSTPTIIVNSLLDNGPGNCTAQCTLRDAVLTANNNANSDNIIQFGDLTGTILLTNVATMITSTKNLTIQGPGADTLTIDFNNGTNNSIRQSAGNLSVSGLTFTKNNYNAFYVTAANQTFTLSDSVVTANPSKPAVNIKTGAAIVVNISNTIFSNNTGALQGGAIFNSSIGSNMTITNSTFSGNTTTMQGGAIYTANVITTINKSTFSGNAGPLGGAIYTTSSARLLSVTNSTFFNNTATNNGSMIEAGTPTNITNSTFVDNTSTSGYGIYINNSSSVVNSIFYSNPANTGYAVCGGSLTSSGYNIDSGTSCGLTGTGDQNSTDPLLSPSWLTNNGGLVKTIALLANSPAKDAGNDGSAPVTDARGYARSGIADIGAYEYQDGGDIDKPIITAFSTPATSSSLTVDITSLVATDTVGVTGYMLTEVNTEPAPGNVNWSGSAPTNYTFATEGTKTLYAWAKDAVGNISTSSSAPVTITLPPDVTKPVIDAFTLPATSISLTVDIASLVATDNKGVTGYMLTEVNTEPAPGNVNWSGSAPTNYTFATEGTKTLYAWAKDAAGNISLSASDQVVITLSPVLSYAGSFTETIANDGSVTGSRYATLVNDTFAHPDSTLTEGVDYTIGNKPAGLSAVMVVNGEGTIATLTFTGNVVNHQSTDKVSNLTITFLDGAFTDTPIASDVLGYINSDSDITFNNNTVIVNSLLDDGDGTCTEIKCTLRDAVATAQPNDTIQFGNLSGTIVLTNHTPITITQDLVIQGPGASNLTIDFDNNGNTYIDQAGGNLTISGLTLTHAPYNAVYMDFPSISFTLNNAVVANNTDQPAIQANSIFRVIINNSTFYNNTSGYFSAALFSLANTTTITNSTFYNNHGQRSGAVYVEESAGTFTLTNSTFYNNTSIEGYSMFESDTFMTNITNSTFVDTISTGSSATAGISIDHASHVTNSIFYSNPSNSGYRVCNTSIGSFGHNIDSANSCGLSQVTTDLVSTDPLLDLEIGLQSNGGAVQTVAFLANSPARDTGTNVGTPATDARGYMRVGVADIGAYEYPDTIKPVINPFIIPETSSSLTVPITTLVATDNVRVTGYILTLTDVEPALNDAHWTANAPTTYTFSTEGLKTLYSWARDAAGNVSLTVSDQVTISVPVPPHGGGGGPKLPYGCTDPKALNYTKNVLSRSSMCRYAPGVTPTKPVIPPATPIVPNTPPKLDSAPNNIPLCSARLYPTKYIRLGQENDPEQVNLLEQYLTLFEGENLPIDSVYSPEDADAVIRWQEKYRSDILTPWDIPSGTGYVFITSLRKFRELFEAQCKKDDDTIANTPAIFTRDLRLGMKGDDVRKLQEILIAKATGGAAQNLARVGATGYFGPMTKTALIEFQKAHLLNPATGEMGIITIYLLTEV